MKLLPLLAAVLLLVVPTTCFSQYMFLDCDGDSANTSADHLNASGPTDLTLYLDTTHDQDGTLRSCNGHTGAPTSGSPLNLFSFTVVLKASNGTVAWGSFVASDPSYAALGTDMANSSDTEFARIRPPGTFTPTGLARLGTIQVSVLSGTPQVAIGTSTTLDPFGFGTGFATLCEGSEFANTYVLGTDWFDIAGVSAGSGAGAQQMNVTASGGIVYLGGNRLSPPFTISYVKGRVLINGKFIPPPQTAAYTPTVRDWEHARVRKVIWRVMEQGLGTGMADQAIVQAVVDSIRGFSAVASATPGKRSVGVVWQGETAPDWFSIPDNFTLHPATGEQLESGRWQRLVNYQRALSRGSLLFLGQGGEIIYPPRDASTLDSAIQGKRSGRDLTPAEQEVFDSLSAELRSESVAPVALKDAQ